MQSTANGLVLSSAWIWESRIKIMKRRQVFVFERSHYLSAVPECGFSWPDLEHIRFLEERNVAGRDVRGFVALLTPFGPSRS